MKRGCAHWSASASSFCCMARIGMRRASPRGEFCCAASLHARAVVLRHVCLDSLRTASVFSPLVRRLFLCSEHVCGGADSVGFRTQTPHVSTRIGTMCPLQHLSVPKADMLDETYSSGARRLMCSSHAGGLVSVFAMWQNMPSCAKLVLALASFGPGFPPRHVCVCVCVLLAAHRLAPDLRRTRLCDFYARGRCKETDCRFAHGATELRDTDAAGKTVLSKLSAKSKRLQASLKNKWDMECVATQDLRASP